MRYLRAAVALAAFAALLSLCEEGPSARAPQDGSGHAEEQPGRADTQGLGVGGGPVPPGRAPGPSVGEPVPPGRAPGPFVGEPVPSDRARRLSVAAPTPVMGEQGQPGPPRGEPGPCPVEAAPSGSARGQQVAVPAPAGREEGRSAQLEGEECPAGPKRVPTGAKAVLSTREALGLRGMGAAPAGDPVPSRAEPFTKTGSWPTWPESASVEVLQHNRLVCRVIVYSTLEEVWQRITTVRSFVLWYPPWKGEQDMKRSLTGVGDTLSYLSGTGCGGRSVVTWYEPLEELRIVHELADGGRDGSIRFRIQQAEKGVGLVVEEVLSSSGIDILRARRELCKRTILIKRLAEGE